MAEARDILELFPLLVFFSIGKEEKVVIRLLIGYIAQWNVHEVA